MVKPAPPPALTPSTSGLAIGLPVRLHDVPRNDEHCSSTPGCHGAREPIGQEVDKSRSCRQVTAVRSRADLCRLRRPRRLSNYRRPALENDRHSSVASCARAIAAAARALKVEQDEKAPIVRDIVAAGRGRAFRVPHIGNDTVPGSAMKPSDNGKAFDLVLQRG